MQYTTTKDDFSQCVGSVRVRNTTTKRQFPESGIISNPQATAPKKVSLATLGCDHQPRIAFLMPLFPSIFSFVPFLTLSLTPVSPLYLPLPILSLPSPFAIALDLRTATGRAINSKCEPREFARKPCCPRTISTDCKYGDHLIS
jgi:hypothetical protein